MSVLVERGIEFDFTKAVSVKPHDNRSGGHGNSYWRGVDFCIEDASEMIWLEVKNWDPASIPPKNRGGSKWSFICKMKSNTFGTDMRNKFLGTTAFLSWTGEFLLAPTRFVLLFEPPPAIDFALLSAMQTRMNQLIPNKPLWRKPIYVAVLNLTEWNRRFSQYPAKLL